MKHLLSIADLDRASLEELLGLSGHFLEVTQRDIPKVPALRGKVVVSLFYEDSTRTRISFETAAKRLSCDVMSFSIGSSSVQKGESLRDTVQTIEAMGIDAVVIRHPAAGAPHRVASWVDASVVNAGDGCHEHPTQALLDALTLRRHLGADLNGARIAIVGDILHSRVARSSAAAFATLGATVTLVGPPTLLPPSLEGWPVTVSHDLDAVLPDADVVYLLRIQHERRNASLFPSLREYTALLRPHRRPGCATAQGRARHAPRADEPWRRDRRRSGRGARVTHHRTSHERSRRADGRPLLAPGSGGLACLKRTCSSAADASSTGTANASPTCSCAADASSRSAPVCRATRPSTRRAASWRPGSSISTCTCASRAWKRPRRSKPVRAAALGGFTAVVAMPNTEPALDDPAIVASVLAAGEHASCTVVSSGCITKGRAGVALAPMGELHQLGVRIFTDDGACVADANVMRHALEYSLALPGAVVAQHAEDADLAGNGSMHEGAWSSRLGIPGRPAAAEDVIVARDLILAELTGARVHFLHVSTAGAVELVARGEGARPSDHRGGGAPSLHPHRRSVRELRSGVQGAPAAAHRRRRRRDQARSRRRHHRRHRQRSRTSPGGAQGAPVRGGARGDARARDRARCVLTELVEPGVLSLADALALMSWRPAAIAGLTDQGQPIAPGAVANLCVIDPAVTWEVDALRLASKARNTPFAGRKLTGRVRHTILRGQPVVIDGESQR